MNIEKLPTDYVDSVAEQYKYRLSPKSSDLYEVIDESEYTEIGSFWTANNVNTMNKTINQVNGSVETNSKRLDEIVLGTIKDSNLKSLEALNTPKANVFNTPCLINDVAFDGSQAITIEDNAKVSSDDSFILAKDKTLSFSNNVCTITDKRITENSLANVIFSRDSVSEAFRCVVTVDTFDGNLKITAKRTPKISLVATILIRS